MNIGDVFLSVRADLSSFQASMSGLNSQVSRSASDMGKSLSKVGQGLTSTGGALTRNLTLPLLAAGGAVTHFALDFDTTMRRIVGLAKVPQEEIEGISDAILKMGEDIGRAPQELAEAFYFVASAGFKAKDAMEVLRISATAAAAGMGETQDIAKTLGGVINAYGHENLTAARAGDILTAAIQDGAAEASDFAGVIGSVVPVAASLGVSFDQVSAAIAAMTQVGISADTAATNLGQVMAALQKPTKEAEEAMEGLGLSSAGLRKQLREEGLLATLRTLEERFAGNADASAIVFGNIRALRGVTALLGLDTEQLNGIFADTAGALGNLKQAYDDTDGPQRRLDKAMASLQASAITLGTDVLPQVVEVVEEVGAGVRRLSRWWSSLDKDTRKNIVQWLAWSAAVGPVLLIVGKLVSGLGAVFKMVAFLSSAKGIPAFIKWASLARLAVLGWAGAMLLLLSKGDDITLWVDELLNGAKATAKLKKLFTATGDMGIAIQLREAGITAKDFALAVEKAGGDATAAIDAIKDAGGDLGKALFQLGLDSETAGGLFEGWGSRSREVAQAAIEAGRAAKDIPENVAAELVNGAFVVEEAAEEMIDPAAEAVEKAKQDVADAANDLISTLATALSADPKELEEAAEEMWETILHPFPDIKRRGKIEAILSSKLIAEGLRSDDSRVRADTAEYVKGLLAEYELMSPGALAAGELVNPALKAGLDSNLQALKDYLTTTTGDIVDQFDLADALDTMGYTALASYVRGMERARIEKLQYEAGQILRQTKIAFFDNFYPEGLGAGASYQRGIKAGLAGTLTYVSGYTQEIANLFKFSGSPDYTHSREAGEGVGRTYMQSLVATLKGLIPGLATTIGGVASALMAQPMGVGMAVPSMAGAGIGGSTISAPSIGGSVTNNYNLHVTGKLPVDDAQDALSALRRLAGIKKD